MLKFIKHCAGYYTANTTTTLNGRTVHVIVTVQRHDDEVWGSHRRWSVAVTTHHGSTYVAPQDAPQYTMREARQLAEDMIRHGFTLGPFGVTSAF